MLDIVTQYCIIKTSKRENKIAELLEGKKITYRRFVYWLNPVPAKFTGTA